MVKIQIDATKLNPAGPLSFGIGPENKLPEPEVGVDGISFSEMPTFGRVLATGIFAFGAITFGQVNLSDQISPPIISIAIPVAQANDAASRYRELRERITESGIPMLDDDELRQEIRDRRGAQDDD